MSSRYPVSTDGAEVARAAAEACGLEVADLRTVRLRAELHDVGAVVQVLRTCVRRVPGFTVERYRETLERLHRQITREGPCVAHPTRFLIEAGGRRPDGRRAQARSCSVTW